MNAAVQYSSFLHNCRKLLGDEAVRFGSMLSSTTGESRQISAHLLPQTAEQVQEIVKLANEFSIPLYPISTGNNWGYGSNLPVDSNCVLVELSRMDRILEFDPAHGVVTIEPGVTQQKLYSFLKSRSLPWLVPVHGGGGRCSIIGNALERGYGITPASDHFGAIRGLQAVLANGSLYRGPFEAAGVPRLDQLTRWGFGPYLNGLFSQSAFGIVTSMTIALEPIPECVEALAFNVKGPIEEFVEVIHRLLPKLGTANGGINLMNRRRVLAMARPDLFKSTSGIVDEAILAYAGDKMGITPWIGFGGLYGTKAFVKAAKEEIRKEIPWAKFFSRQSLQRMQSVARFIPGDRGAGVRTKLNTVGEALSVLYGQPQEVALRLAYLKNSKKPTEDLQPERDGCGLIWHSPVIPIEPQVAKAFVQQVEKTCRDHGIEPLITLTTISKQCFDSTVPILFDRNNEFSKRAAHNCQKALYEAGKALGVAPYRYGISQMGNLGDAEAPFWQTVAALKDTLDPNGILSPGRYDLRTRKK